MFYFERLCKWYGSIVGLSYIAAQRTFPDYGEMADAKSLLESFARSFGYHYGKKKHVRVNTQPRPLPVPVWADLMHSITMPIK
jgi:enoyl-[acyl-carrier-protein] reductase (NADH)